MHKLSAHLGFLHYL